MRVCVCVCVCACVARLSAAVLPPSPPPCELLCAAEAICVRARGWPGPRPERSDGACPASSLQCARSCVWWVSLPPPSPPKSPDVCGWVPGTCRATPGTVTRRRPALYSLLFTLSIQPYFRLVFCSVQRSLSRATRAPRGSRFYGWDDSVATRGFLLCTSRMLIETHDAKRKYARR